MHLYRIAQEALSNALRHSYATTINISLKQEGDRFTMEISDNGCGIRQNDTSSKGMGLLTIRYRSQLINANLEIKNQAAGGAFGAMCARSFPCPQPSLKTRPRVLIVGDHHMFREWLGKTIGEEGTFTVCGEADNIRERLHTDPAVAAGSRCCSTLRCGIERAGAAEEHEVVWHRYAGAGVVDARRIAFAERALRAGAKGYITKYAASSTLFDALKRVLSGKIYLAEEMTSVILENDDAIDAAADWDGGAGETANWRCFN